MAVVKNDHIVIHFYQSNNCLRIAKSRFISAYNMLKENSGKWVRIGAKRVNANPETIKGRIKLDYNGNMSGISTAPWIAAILVEAFDNIVFNGKKKCQALMMVENEQDND